MFPPKRKSAPQGGIPDIGPPGGPPPGPRAVPKAAPPAGPPAEATAVPPESQPAGVTLEMLQYHGPEEHCEACQHFDDGQSQCMLVTPPAPVDMMGHCEGFTPTGEPEDDTNQPEPGPDDTGAPEY